MKPFASTMALESLVLWSHNQTATWLKQLPTLEKDLLMERARRDKLIVQQFHQRASEIKRQRLEILYRKQSEKLRKEDLVYARKVSASKALYGKTVICSLADLTQLLKNKTEKDKVVILNEQIKYHYHVLESQGSRKLLQKTLKGKALDSEQLQSNLEEILTINESRR